MEKKQFHRRGLGMLLLLAVILFGLGSSLYDAQMIHGAEYLARSQNSIAETQTVEAARGDILDRYGRVLVSNRVTYQVALNTDAMEKNRNDILLALIRIARDAGVEWEDTLPITAQPPFRYTTDTPFQYPTTDEEGSPTTSLTRLGRLAVKMKWIDDPTADGAQGAPLPTAEELLEKMRESFQLELEGADMRAVAGVLYELYYRSMVNSWPPYVFAEGVDIDFISKVKEQGLSGVEIEAATVRTYNTEYAAHLLGRVGAIENWDAYKDLDLDGDGTPDYEMDDTVGKEGAELAFESYLRGTAGVREVERNTSGKVVSEKWTTAPQPGDNVVLTIDIDLQKQVEDILSQAIPQLASEDTEGAACVVMDVNRAEVLASASYPSYHLATYSADLAENSADPLKPFLNRAFQGVYAPGSTFKMVTAVAGLESGIIEPDTEIMDTGVYTYYQDDGPQCWYWRQYRRKHGLVNVSEALEVSCNVFFFDVGRRVGIQGLQEFAAKFGLGEPTGIELYEETGVMAGPEYTQSMGQTWYEGSTLSVAIGQESSQFTPLQLANYIATLVNGGTRYSAHLLKEVKSSDFSQVLYTYEPEVLDSIDIQPENLDAVKAGMLALTTGKGSLARYFQDLPVQVGAKTGSAQVNAETESNAVFVCFAPYDDPQIAISLVVEKGGSGSTLASIAADILRYYFSAEESREETLTENTLIR
ncbi:MULTISPECIES: penicillin-binding transpeptidase domain-containing protein [Eubacteriales]|uniref:penicillin-binding transpeptidase domain-containing protein n=1 Tax=Eubacteriales TaxID=186802 RepID=UPI000D2E2205|nr:MULTISPECIES: penicillin-binding transpeptidase domain-containing protein [Eubacteriales]MBP8859311.1 penicillin-binding protein [Lawsonibacter sp.]MBS5506157.1 penicillin-binding protein [Oscillospiraceae bacterium]MCB5927426.1 penicillin-binding protein [bacterium 210820-DFI.5.26]MEE0112874.1 penicillin-binding transpeptidase domain-containing protein [Eubacteriales bacterium]MCQ5159892.1 penicillin-binding transpeptidase domain-containing protein [Clostridium sp. DFI.5.61]